MCVRGATSPVTSTIIRTPLEATKNPRVAKTSLAVWLFCNGSRTLTPDWALLRLGVAEMLLGFAQRTGNWPPLKRIIISMRFHALGHLAFHRDSAPQRYALFGFLASPRVAVSPRT
jgi:hypothetical protein